MNHLFCFGLGYSATFLARQLLAKGWRVTGTCRSRDTQVELSRLGIEAHLFDRDHPIGNLADAAGAGDASLELGAAG